jgi:hypothetical protein
MRAKAGDEIPQSELIAESATMTPPYYLGIFCNCETGSGANGRATANKMWVSPKFFLFPGIFPLKIENHLQKFHKKIRRVRSRFVIGSVDPALLTSSTSASRQ